MFKVGFLPCNIVREKQEKFVDMFAQVIEIYDDSDSVTRRRKVTEIREWNHYIY